MFVLLVVLRNLERKVLGLVDVEMFRVAVIEFKEFIIFGLCVGFLVIVDRDCGFGYFY